MIEEDLRNDWPEFSFTGDAIWITGKSIPEDAREVWGPFVQELKLFINKRKKAELNFKLDVFNTASSMYLTNIFSVLNEKRKQCHTVTNWYYFEADEDMEFLGETYQERNQFLKINLIPRND